MRRSWWPKGAILGIVATFWSAPLTSQTGQFAVTPDTGVVLDPEAAGDVRTVCSRPFPGGLEGYWQPTLSDLKRLEAALPDFLEAQVPQLGRPLAATIPIYRQYVGMYRAGRKVVYVNGFTAIGDPDLLRWRTEVLVVCDGGPTFFGAVFELGTERFTEFHGNGMP